MQGRRLERVLLLLRRQYAEAISLEMQIEVAACAMSSLSVPVWRPPQEKPTLLRLFCLQRLTADGATAKTVLATHHCKEARDRTIEHKNDKTS